MRPASCMTLAFALLCGACSSPSSPIAPTGLAAAPALGSSADREATPRPLQGRCDTSFVNVFESPTRLRQTIEYVCQLGHLGRTTALAEQIVNPQTGEAHNTTTYTAANGDQLCATWTGGGTTSDGVSFAFEGDEVYTACPTGAGRFAHASGSSHIVGTASFDTNTGQFSLTGELVY